MMDGPAPPTPPPAMHGQMVRALHLRTRARGSWGRPPRLTVLSWHREQGQPGWSRRAGILLRPEPVGLVGPEQGRVAPGEGGGPRSHDFIFFYFY